jgi:hypothetical protein
MPISLLPYASNTKHRYALSADETAARKKLKSDLEFKKKESERRKKKPGTASNLTRSKSDKSPNQERKSPNLKENIKENSKEEKETSATPETQKRKNNKKAEPSIDDQIAALQPVEGIQFLYIKFILYCFHFD